MNLPENINTGPFETHRSMRTAFSLGFLLLIIGVTFNVFCDFK